MVAGIEARGGQALTVQADMSQVANIEKTDEPKGAKINMRAVIIPAFGEPEILELVVRQERLSHYLEDYRKKLLIVETTTSIPVHK